LHEDGITIPLTLTNPLQEDLLNGFRGELLPFLRSALKNSQLRLDVQIVKDAPQRRLYTPGEKFNYLLEKYPALQQLKDRLGLDPDY
jgi:DNA polymerase III subunit gamma/tau